jgi:hypothetical protein
MRRWGETHVAVDPLEPLFGSMPRLQVLQIINCRDTLRLGGAQEILHDRILTAELRITVPGKEGQKGLTSFRERL